MSESPVIGGREPSIIAAYLDDLRRTLRHTNAEDAADIVQSVQEHIDAALSGIAAPTTEQVQAVIDGLGPIERIAAIDGDSSPAAVGESYFTAHDPRVSGGAPLAAVLLSVLAVGAMVLSGLWFIAAPLGVAVLAASLIARRRATGQARTAYLVSAVLGVGTIVVALAVALLLTAATKG